MVNPKTVYISNIVQTEQIIIHIHIYTYMCVCLCVYVYICIYIHAGTINEKSNIHFKERKNDIFKELEGEK